MIEIRELVKTFDGFAALDGASVSVPQGAIYGLVGPNGAGKSTLLRHLTGVYRQDSGSIAVDGEQVWENVAVKQRIASIPDDWHYFMQSSIRDMMKFYRGFYPQFNMERYRRKAAHPPPFQGNAEAGGVLARHVLYARLPHSG